MARWRNVFSSVDLRVELEGFEPQEGLARRVERLEQNAKGASPVACGFNRLDG